MQTEIKLVVPAPVRGEVGRQSLVVGLFVEAVAFLFMPTTFSLLNYPSFIPSD
jgi:hypothetical protein